MKFARQGYPAAAVPAAVGLAVGLLAGWMYGAALLVLAFAVLLFFRDPERSASEDPTAVISPADGRVVMVEKNVSGHRLAEELTTKIAIFMSPLDVHINRMPVAGTVDKIEHRTGQFRAAYTEDASDINESNSLVVSAERGYRLVVVQIAGWLARRIVCYIPERSRLARGERFGLIMFGSRVDVFLPAGAEPAVQPGRRVRAGETVIAHVEAKAD